MNRSRATIRTAGVAARALLAFTLVLGIGYTAAITLVGQLIFPAQVNGSLIRDDDGTIRGSSLIGQAFVDAEGQPLPAYFQSRPSAAGSGYDGAASSGSNAGPENEELIATISERRQQVADFNGVTPEEVPADAVTASASGLDPHISPAYAHLQVDRVAQSRRVSATELRTLVAANTSPPDLGYLGEPTVNVVELNRALDGWER